MNLKDNSITLSIYLFIYFKVHYDDVIGTIDDGDRCRKRRRMLRMPPFLCLNFFFDDPIRYIFSGIKFSVGTTLSSLRPRWSASSRHSLQADM